ncbi:Uncharacterised protein [Candidatus Bilamarchaeum dharawalense]|uniref:N-acetyltransferase domain-containing protein n=1 Tax=Candidatus Bilamarchaeum dharawalense TaxID=2885759 RepID=A0A5E4LKB2_9ARCH|nr:Uncharacterised protein [Candidatus Bilamarchaeum dharawalense]
MRVIEFGDTFDNGMVVGHEEIDGLYSKIFPEKKQFKTAPNWFYLFLVDDNEKLIGIASGGVSDKVIINHLGLVEEHHGSGLEKKLIDYLKKNYPNKEILIEVSRV